MENGEDHKNVVLLYQDSRSGLCREHSAWLLHWLRSRIPHCPAAPVLLLLLPHTQAKREQNMFFFPPTSLAPKIKKNDMDIIIPSVTVPAEQDNTKA